MRGDIDDVNSYDDSEQFEEDSIASYVSDSEPITNRFIDWKMDTSLYPSFTAGDKSVPSLLTLCSRIVGQKIPFELVETHKKEIPPHCQELISYHCFPCNENQIRLYSCLTTGTGQEFDKGLSLFTDNAVKDCRQIGFRITASVKSSMLDNPVHQSNYLRAQQNSQQQGSGTATSNLNTSTGTGLLETSSNGPVNHITYHISIAIDRHTITECICTCCTQQGYWCRHIVAVILCRIRSPDRFAYSLPISENLNTLSRDDLQKFAQFLIAALPPTEMLPAAQIILDKLLSKEPNEIKNAPGGPDSTSGGSVRDIPHWCFDEKIVREKLNKILQKFIVPGPIICCEKNFLNHMPGPTLEYWAFLRPLRSKEPEGIWNLICIIENLFRSQDSNGLSLLRLLTRSLLETDTVMVWWYSVRSNIPLPARPSAPNAGSNNPMIITASAGTMYANNGGNNYANNYKCHLSAADFCDEMVHLWHLASIQPTLTSSQRKAFIKEMEFYHQQAVAVAEHGMERLVAHRVPLMGPSTINVGSSSSETYLNHIQSDSHGASNNRQQICLQKMRASQSNRFPGFLPAIEAARLVWDDSKLPSSLLRHFNDVASIYSLHDSYLHTLSPDKSDQQVAYGNASSSNAAADITDSKSISYSFHNESDSANKMVSESLSYGGDDLFSRWKDGTNAFEILFDRCQALYCHGHLKEAVPLVQRLSEQILSRQDVLFQEGDDAVLLCKRLCRLMDNQYSLVTHGSVEVTSSVCGYSNAASSTPVSCGNTRTPPQRSSNYSSPRNAYSSGGRQSKYRRGTSNNSTTSNNQHSNETSFRNTVSAIPFVGALAAWPKDKLRLLLYARDSVEAVAKETSRLFSYVLFLCRCLMEDNPCQEHQIILVFRLCFLCLTLPRPPTIDKALQVRLINQETEIVTILRRLGASPINSPQLSAHNHGSGSSQAMNAHSSLVNGSTILPATCYQMLRQQAQLMRRKVSPYLSSHIPFHLATFIFEKLSLPYVSFSITGEGPSSIVSGVRRRNFSRSGLHVSPPHIATTEGSSAVSASSTSGTENCNSLMLKEDHLLGFEAAVACLGVKLPVSEKLFPMLIEGQRKQKDDLAMLLCNHYKHDPCYLERILDELLDRAYNPDFKAPPLTMCVNLSVEELIHCYEEDEAALNASSNNLHSHSTNLSTSHLHNFPHLSSQNNILNHRSTTNSSFRGSSSRQYSTTTRGSSTRRFRRLPHKPSLAARLNMITLVDVVASKTARNVSTSRLVPMKRICSEEKSSDIQTSDQDDKSKSNVVAGPSSAVRMAGVDSSAPETTSSGDTSPATARRRCQAALSLLSQHAVQDEETEETEETQSSSGAESDPVATNIENPTSSLRLDEEDGSLHLDENSRHLSADDLLMDDKIPRYNFSTRSSPVPLQTQCESGVTTQETSLLSLNMDESQSSFVSLKSSVTKETDLTPLQDLLSCSNFLARLAFPSEDRPAASSSGVDGKLDGSRRQATSINDGSGNIPNHGSTEEQHSHSSVTYFPGEDDMEDCCEDDENLDDDETDSNVTSSMAYHMYELGEKLIQEAGGVDARGTMHFTQHYAAANTNNTNSATASHQVGGNANHAVLGNRNLQLCGFMVCLYSLGLLNRTSPTWQSRAYSMHVTAISNRVNEIGAKAAYILLVTWRKHFTPSEVAQIADKASKFTDRLMTAVAAELCLSFLSESSMLKPQEISRALEQCKEQSSSMLERALFIVEKGAELAFSSILPEVFFHLAHCWDELFVSAVSREALPAATRGSCASSQKTTSHSRTPQSSIKETNHQRSVNTPPQMSVQQAPQQPQPQVLNKNWIQTANHGINQIHYATGNIPPALNGSYVVPQSTYSLPSQHSSNNIPLVIPCTALPPPGYQSMCITTISGSNTSHRGTATSVTMANAHAFSSSHLSSPSSQLPQHNFLSYPHSQSPPQVIISSQGQRTNMMPTNWNGIQLNAPYSIATTVSTMSPLQSHIGTVDHPLHVSSNSRQHNIESINASVPSIVDTNTTNNSAQVSGVVTSESTGSTSNTAVMTSNNSSNTNIRSGAYEKLQRAFTCCIHALYIIIRTHTRQELISATYSRNSTICGGLSTSSSNVVYNSYPSTNLSTSSSNGAYSSSNKSTSTGGMNTIIKQRSEHFGEIHWGLKHVAMKLGVNEIIEYCEKVMQCVSYPKEIETILLEVLNYFEEHTFGDLPKRSVLAQGDSCESASFDLEEMLSQLSHSQSNANLTNQSGSGMVAPRYHHHHHHRSRHNTHSHNHQHKYSPSSSSATPLSTSIPQPLASSFSPALYQPQQHVFMLQQLAAVQHPQTHPLIINMMANAAAAMGYSSTPPLAVLPPSSTTSVLVNNIPNMTSIATPTNSHMTELSPLAKSVVDLVHRLRNKIHIHYRLRLETLLQLMSEKDYADCASEIVQLYQTSLSFPAVDGNHSFSRILVKLRNHPKCNDKLWNYIDAALRLIDSEKIVVEGGRKQAAFC